MCRKTTKPNGTEFRYLVCTEKRCTGLHGVRANKVEAIVLQEMKNKLEALNPVVVDERPLDFEEAFIHGVRKEGLIK